MLKGHPPARGCIRITYIRLFDMMYFKEASYRAHEYRHIYTLLDDAASVGATSLGKLTFYQRQMR